MSFQVRSRCMVAASTSWEAGAGPAGAALAGAGPGRFLGGAFDTVPVGLPRGLVGGREVGPVRGQADGPVDELADDVGVPGVPARFGGHADQDVMQRDLVLVG